MAQKSLPDYGACDRTAMKQGGGADQCGGRRPYYGRRKYSTCGLRDRDHLLVSVHRRDGDRHHGSADHRRRRSRASGRSRNNRDKAHSTAGHNNRSGEALYGSANDRDAANNGDRPGNVPARRWTIAAPLVQLSYQPAPLKLDWQAVPRRAEARQKTAT